MSCYLPTALPGLERPGQQQYSIRRQRSVPQPVLVHRGPVQREQGSGKEDPQKEAGLKQEAAV